MPPKKLKVQDIQPSPEISEILEKLKVKEGVVEPQERKISDKQKEHLEQIRVKALQAKKAKQEKLDFLQKYYIESQKKEINSKLEKEKYAKRKASAVSKKSPPPPPIEEDTESITDDEDDDDVEYSEVEEESEEEPEYVPQPKQKKKQPAKVSVPVKKSQPTPRVSYGNTQSKIGPQPPQQYNPFAGVI